MRLMLLLPLLIFLSSSLRDKDFKTFALNTHHFESSSHYPVSDWALIKDSSNVSFSYKLDVCNNEEMMLLKISNNNAQTVNVKWSIWDTGPIQAVAFSGGEEKIGECSGNNYLIYHIPPGLVLGGNVLPQLVITVLNL